MTRARFIIVALLLSAIAGAVVGIWPTLSTQRLPHQSRHEWNNDFIGDFAGTKRGFLMEHPKNRASKIGWETRSRWDSRVRSRVYWDDEGWRVFELREESFYEMIALFWENGEPQQAYSLVRHSPSKDTLWNHSALPPSSPHFPDPLTAPDAPWILEGISREEWWNRVSAE